MLSTRRRHLADFARPCFRLILMKSRMKLSVGIISLALPLRQDSDEIGEVFNFITAQNVSIRACRRGATATAPASNEPRR